jgi:hypothetical protein
MRFRLPALAALSFTLACDGSFHPAYTEQDLIFDPALLGTWYDSSEASTATVSTRDSLSYVVSVSDSLNRSAAFSAHLARLDDVILLDVYPEDLPGSLEESYRAHFLRFHSVHFVEMQGNRLVMRQVGGESLRAFLRRHPGAVAHVMVDSATVLTASTVEVRRFLSLYSGAPGALSDSSVLTRVTSTP